MVLAGTVGAFKRRLDEFRKKKKDFLMDNVCRVLGRLGGCSGLAKPGK